MLRLRLEVQPNAHIHEVCTQATRIATQLGVEVVFEFSCKEVIAKPGMNAESLKHECLGETQDLQVKPEAQLLETVKEIMDICTPKKPTEPIDKKGGKGGKKKDPIPDTTPKDVQEEAL
jgi:hypothetical protein